MVQREPDQEGGVPSGRTKGPAIAKKGDDEAAAAGLRFRSDVMLAESDAVMETATDFQKRATSEMGRVHAEVVEYLKTYRLAHADISKRLGKAGAEAASQAAMIDAVTGILAGTGVGLVLPRLVDGYRKMRTVGLFSKATVKKLTLAGQATVEATGETAELGIGAALGGDPKQFELPPELSADLVAAEQWQQLAEGWKTLAEAALGITEFGNARYDLLRELHKSLSGVELRALLDGWTERDVLGQMRSAITEADDAMAGFTAVMDTPLLHRNQYVLSQELLIKWMVSLAPKSERDTENVDGDDLDPIDDMETVLAEFNILAGPYGSGPADNTRLGVDFGDRWTSTADQVKAYQAAVWEKRRIGYIGRLGVILMRNSQPFVRLSHQVYAATGRPDPAPGDIEWTMGAVARGTEPLQEGQVVIVAALQPRWVFVDPLKGGPILPYGPVAMHPRTVRQEEAKRRKEEEKRRKEEEERRKQQSPTPADDFVDPIREAQQETEERFGPLPAGDLQQHPEPQADESAPFCLAPDEYDTTISPDDPGLDPEAKKLCFGDEEVVAH